MTVLEAALKYCHDGYSVIPAINKQGIVGWTEWQTKKADAEQIRFWWKQYPNANVAIVTGKISDLVVIDVDDPAGETALDQYLPDSLITPIEMTPGGGKHIYFKYPIDGEIRNSQRAFPELPKVDVRADGGMIVITPSKDDRGFYHWIKGLELGVVAPQELPLALYNILSFKSFKIARTVPKLATESNNHYKILQKGTRDSDLFKIGMALADGKCPDWMIEQVLQNLALAADPPFPQTEIQAKIKSIFNRTERKGKNLAEEVREFFSLQQGYTMTTEVQQTLQLTTREEKKNLTVILSRLQEQGIIERYGEKRGCYRPVDRSVEVINIREADTSPLYLRLPLEPENFVKLHKGNVIILAGESNAGKTAYCLNVAQMNRDRFNVKYLTSEMQNGTELRIRVDEFNQPIETWDNIIFQYRIDDFADAVDPEGLNIVDYLDEGTDHEAYKMPHRIKKIAAKLTTGIVLIAIQKSSQKTFGLGGESTMNTARLYMTISRENILKIEKGKIWANKFLNPNGLKVKFRLSAGCHFSKAEGEDWKR